MDHSGAFITIEGIEGAGKSTAINYICEVVNGWGVNPVITREPGGTPLGEQVRKLVLHGSDVPVSDEAELLLMFAGRAQHLHQLIWPALQKGEFVICDRFTDATFAYQGGGRNISEPRIEQLELWLQGQFRPDLTLLLDIDPEVGFKRIAKERGDDLDRIEMESIHFFGRVRQNYLKRAAAFPERFRVIDASKSLKEVEEQLKYALNEFWNKKNGS